MCAEVQLMVGSNPPCHVNVKRLHVEGRKRVMTFTTGWPSFLRDNKERVGDLLIFEQLKIPSPFGYFPHIKVDIVR